MNLKVQVMVLVVVVWLVGGVVAPWWGDKKEKEKKEEPKKGKDKNRPAVNPKLVYKDVSSVDVTSWAQMINRMKNTDQCRDGKTPASVASLYCKQVITLLDKLPPYMRSDDCRHVTAGACRKLTQNDPSECTLKTYTYIKCGGMVLGWKTNSNTLRLRDCVGHIEWDEARHKQWLAANAAP